MISIFFIVGSLAPSGAQTLWGGRRKGSSEPSESGILDKFQPLTIRRTLPTSKTCRPTRRHEAGPAPSRRTFLHVASRRICHATVRPRPPLPQYRRLRPPVLDARPDGRRRRGPNLSPL